VVSGAYNLTIEKGTDFSLCFRLKNGGETFDLSDWVFASQVRENPGSPVVADLDTAISEDGERLTISLDFETTSDLDAGAFVWDLFCIRPDGVHMRLLEGQVTIVERVTHA
jgi:hypothetical protein